MFTIIIIFLIVATIFALATLAYVAIDLVLEKKQKEEAARAEEEEPCAEDPYADKF